MPSLIENYARQPVTFVKGEGSWLTDADGKRYLDFLTGISVCNTGHCHPHVVKAIQDQAATLMHVSNLFWTEPMAKLADRLATGLPDGRVLYQNSGAEANEAALKLCRKARPKGNVISVHLGFHGRTFGALSATPQESKQAPFAPLVPGFRAVEPTAEALTEAIDDDTACVLIETIRGESGVLPVPDDALIAAREACDRTGAALVFDEVQTGMGRTGTLWSHEQLPVTPDVMTLAKALGGGLPMGAVVASGKWGEVLVAGDHGSTFAGGPVVAAAANAALDVIDDEALLARVRELGERLRHAVSELPGVVEVRGRGLMVGCDLEPGRDAMAIARDALLEQQLVINATGPSTLRFLPPLVVSESEIDQAVQRLGHALA